MGEVRLLFLIFKPAFSFAFLCSLVLVALKYRKKLNECTLPTDSRVLLKAKIRQHRDNVSITLKESQRWKEHTDPR